MTENRIVHIRCQSGTNIDEETARTLYENPTHYDALRCEQHDDIFLVKEFNWSSGVPILPNSIRSD
jgi:hypothetical protein